MRQPFIVNFEARGLPTRLPGIDAGRKAAKLGLVGHEMIVAAHGSPRRHDHLLVLQP